MCTYIYLYIYIYERMLIIFYGHVNFTCSKTLQKKIEEQRR